MPSKTPRGKGFVMVLALLLAAPAAAQQQGQVLERTLVTLREPQLAALEHDEPVWLESRWADDLMG